MLPSDIFRGLEVVEFSSSVASHMMGETLEGVSRNVDTYSYRQPLGVTAGVVSGEQREREAHGNWEGEGGGEHGTGPVRC